MANEEHREMILNQGVTAWNDWRREASQIRPDLNNANLCGANLRGADLSRADLHRANLRRASLRCASLTGADLSDADLGCASLWDAYLSNADLSGANLNGAELSGADLIGADLSSADLTRASLWGAILGNANLRGAILIGADLSRADLRSADFSDANLIHANLIRANLHRANLSGADLSGADLIGANLGATIFFDVDLSRTHWLEEVVHVGSSCISTSTLERSAVGFAQDATRQGAIEAFYRGAGVEEHLIDYFRSRIGQPIEFYSCFISYSHTDKSFARRVYADLQARGIRCWLDEHQMLPGDDIYDMVDRGIRLWDKVLLCCSEASLTSWWVEDEIDKALEKEQKLRKERGEKVLAVIPLNLDGYLFNGWQDGRAATIRKRLAADFTGWATDNAKFEARLDDLIKALQTGGREAPPAPML